MPFYRGTRIPIIGSQAQSSSTFLPQVGPFAASGLQNVSGLSDFSISNRQTFSSLRASPMMYNNFTITATGDYDIRLSTGSAHFIWANNVVIAGGGTLESGGGRGDNGSNGTGGAGASGASGAGGGAGSDSTINLSGGVAGLGVDGTAGASGDLASGGAKGLGWAASTYVLDGYPYPAGGNSDTAGGIGFGGGGNGMANNTPGVLNGGGAGGGGGGLVVLVCNALSGSGQIYCAGGPSGTDFLSTGQAMGGGGGAILVMARSYTGLLATAVNGRDGGTAGTAAIYKINSNNTLTAKLFTDSW